LNGRLAATAEKHALSVAVFDSKNLRREISVEPDDSDD
jgi:hypothetical protein